MSGAILSIRDACKHFGGLTAIHRLSWEVEAGRIHTLVGPNGAGKTTLFNLINGLETLDTGRIHFKGKPIGRLAPHQIAALGIARTFQSHQVFERLNVAQNVQVGRFRHTRVSFAGAGCWWPRVAREEHRSLTETYEILSFLDLYEKAERSVNQITYLEKKLVELGRCLATGPELLLLDEPFGGLTAVEIRTVSDKLNRIRRRGVTVVIIDHHFVPVSEISDTISLLHHGAIIAQGDPQAFGRDSTVRRVYLSRAGGSK